MRNAQRVEKRARSSNCFFGIHPLIEITRIEFTQSVWRAKLLKTLELSDYDAPVRETGGLILKRGAYPVSMKISFCHLQLTILLLEY